MLTQAQQKYFTYSQIRDRSGALIPCYHYTLNEFDAFDRAHIGGQSGDHGYFGSGFYFTGMPCFNSCCWDESGDKTPIRLECYLDIRKPFVMDKLRQGPDYDADRPWLYDAYTFLQYLKDNSDGEDGDRVVIDPEEDFIAYVRANPQEYEARHGTESYLMETERFYAAKSAEDPGWLDWFAADRYFVSIVAYLPVLGNWDGHQFHLKNFYFCSLIVVANLGEILFRRFCPQVNGVYARLHIKCESADIKRKWIKLIEHLLMQYAAPFFFIRPFFGFV